MTPEKNRIWLPVVVIAGALFAWMAVLAAGAYWAPVGEREGGDFRKLGVVAVTTGIFLLLWGFVLLVHRAKVQRQQPDSGDKPGKSGNS